MSLCAPVSLRGQILSGWSATHEAHRPAHLSGTLRLPRVKNPLLLHTPFIRGAKEVENAPVGPGKGVGTSSWEREAVQGPPPLRLGARELLLSTKCPSHTSSQLVCPTGCAWVGFLPSHGSGLGVSASTPPSAGIIVQEGSLGCVLPGNRDISVVLFLFPALILDGKACGTSAWVGKLSRQ